MGRKPKGLPAEEFRKQLKASPLRNKKRFTECAEGLAPKDWHQNRRIRIGPRLRRAVVVMNGGDQRYVVIMMGGGWLVAANDTWGWVYLGKWMIG